jgi:predicted transposase YbfD/YdcC
MHYTKTDQPLQTSANTVTATLSLTPTDPRLTALAQVFAQLNDPRHSPNTTYALPSLLLAVCAALLCNHKNVLATAQCLADQTPLVKAALGFKHPLGRTPHQSTFHRALKQLDVAALEQLLTAYFAGLDQPSPDQPRKRGSQWIAVDGKCQRGRLPFQVEEVKGTPCHLLAAFCQQLGTVLAQTNIVNKEAELTVVGELIQQLDWQGRVFTGDALFCQTKVATQITQLGGDYLLVVKGNQKGLRNEIAQLFEPPSQAEVKREGWAAPLPLEIRTTQKLDKGHGRVEVRQIAVSSELNGYSDWPQLAQVFEIKRQWQSKGEWRSETHYGLTSLPAHLADPSRLLAIRRGHWGIENQLHWVRDVVLGEDASTVHVGSGPQVLSALRNAVLSLMRRAGHSQIRATLRANSRQPKRALVLLGLPVSNA